MKQKQKESSSSSNVSSPLEHLTNLELLELNDVRVTEIPQRLVEITNFGHDFGYSGINQTEIDQRRLIIDILILLCRPRFCHSRCSAA